MARENPRQERRPNIPVYGNGVVPTYYSGSARHHKVPYSKGAKLTGFLITLGLILFVVWATLSMVGLI